MYYNVAAPQEPYLFYIYRVLVLCVEFWVLDELVKGVLEKPCQGLES